MTDDRLPLLGPDGSNHPSVLELSAIIDRALSVREAAAINAHLEACLGCAEQLAKLRAARFALASAGRPQVPPGAMDAAVVTAMANTAQAARDAARGEPIDVLGLLSFDGPIGFRSDGLVAAPYDPANPPKSLTHGGTGSGGSGSGVAGAAANAPRRPPWMPATVDPDRAKDRAVSRHRHFRLAAQAAVAVAVVGIVGGVAVATLHATSGTRSSTAPSTTNAFHAPGGPVRSTTPSLPIISNGPELPPFGTFSLQLRGYIGPDSCAKYSRRVEDIGGNIEAVNPPAAADTVLPLPAAPGAATTCISVGPAFATAWSKVIVSISTTPLSKTAAGAAAMVEFNLTMSEGGVANAPRLATAVAGKFFVEVVGQGADLGAARLTAGAKGTVVSFPVTAPIATFLQQQLTAKT